MGKRLAIIGAGTAGLITVHHALRRLPGWEVRAFHRENHLRGNWGNPYPGFVSTSTRFTTQFSAFRRFDSSVAPGGKQDYEEFFREEEYGNYLEEFVASSSLDSHVSQETEVLQVQREGKQWRVTYRKKNGTTEEELFDAVVIATGLTETPRPAEVEVPVIGSIREREEVRNRTVVVMGGGESAADAANRLAIPDRQNRVYLSLRSGIRVSPRYHPIRGVPSDFLRNRLLLSIDPDLRNQVGQKFVEARIRHRERFERLFPSRRKKLASSYPVEARKRHWDLLLTKTSKDLLFNTFHNKSDGFLDAVGEERIQIIGPPVEGAPNQFRKFDSDETLTVDADLLLPQLGYENHFGRLFSEEKVSLKDFYLGCQHIDHENLFLVGFARPIIGNIPTISEQQARYVTATLAGEIPRPNPLPELHAADRAALEKRFTRIDLDAVYPVEMFPYCDRLARALKTLPTRQALGFRRWLKVQLAPATTMHYLDDDFVPAEIDREVIYTPLVLNGLLGLIRAFDRLRSGSAPPQTRQDRRTDNNSL
ncbi:MAG: NAD(P)-binding domain-containing protein [Verrucomicrobiales bacterium]|nr:NAD(P)-binding domain-containing protein [Verrucomicrobiales bacterium]